MSGISPPPANRISLSARVRIAAPQWRAMVGKYEDILLRDDLSLGTGCGIESPGHGAAVVKVQAGVVIDIVMCAIRQCAA